MMKTTRKIVQTFILGFFMLGMIHCGNGDSNAIRLVLANGQSFEFSIDNAQCFGSIPGTGFLTLPLTCTGAFNGTNAIADGLSVNITDVRIINEQLGTYVPVSPNLLNISLTLDGVQQAVIAGGAVFTQVSNAVGGTTCFEFEVISVQGDFEGSFCGNTGTGFCEDIGRCF